MSQRDPIHFAIAPRDVVLARRPTLTEVHEQLRVVEQSAYQRGLIEGERALSEQLLLQRNELSQLHHGAVAALRDAVPQVVRHTEEALVELAFEIARKLVGDLPITRETVAGTVRDALKEVEAASEFSVLLHADDLALLDSDPARAIGTDHSPSAMRFSASDQVKRGGCLVQTRFGIIDARRETRLASLTQALAPV